MKTAFRALFLCLAVALRADAQSTTFTYQGRLADAGAPANGNYDLTFGLYATNSGGSPVGGILTNSAVLVSNGLFVAMLDFGNVFDGTQYWLEIAVRTNGAVSDFSTLAPRQPLTASPYALYAATARTTTGAIQASQLPTNVALLNGSANFSGPVTASSFSGSGAGITNISSVSISSLGGLQPDNYSNAQPCVIAGAQVDSKVSIGKPAHILVLGDSMSDMGDPSFGAVNGYHTSISYALMQMLQTRYGNDGVGIVGLDTAFNTTNTQKPELSSFLGTGPLFFNASVGGGAFCIRSTDGLPSRWVQGMGKAPAVPVNKIGIWWWQSTNGGDIFVNWTNTPQGGRTIVLQGRTNSNPDFSGGTLVYTNWACSPSTDNQLYFTSSTGTNIIIGVEATSTNEPGVAVYAYQQGGTTIPQMLTIGTANFSNLCSAVQPDLIIWHSKHWGNGQNVLTNLFTVLQSAVGTNTNAAVVMVSTPPSGTCPVFGYSTNSDDTQPTAEAYGRQVELWLASTNLGWYYAPVGEFFPNLTNNCLLGLMDSYTPSVALHTSTAGADIMAELLAPMLGLNLVPSSFNTDYQPFSPPRVTSSQLAQFAANFTEPTPAAGQIVYQTDPTNQALEYYNGTNWVPLLTPNYPIASLLPAYLLSGQTNPVVLNGAFSGNFIVSPSIYLPSQLSFAPGSVSPLGANPPAYTDRNIGNALPLLVGGATYVHGLDCLSPSTNIFFLNQQYSIFSGVCGAGTYGTGTEEFKILGDANTLFDSGAINESTIASTNFTVSVRGVTNLYLITLYTAGNADIAWGSTLLTPSLTGDASGLTSIGTVGTAGGLVTNNGIVWLSTNTAVAPTTPLPNGSICTTTNGQLYVRSNGTWVLH